MDTIQHTENNVETNSLNSLDILKSGSEQLSKESERLNEATLLSGFPDIQWTGFDTNSKDQESDKNRDEVKFPGNERYRMKEPHKVGDDDGRREPISEKHPAGIKDGDDRSPVKEPSKIGDEDDRREPVSERPPQKIKNGKDYDQEKENPDQCGDKIKRPTEEELWEGLEKTHGRIDVDGKIHKGEGLKDPVPEGPIQVKAEKVCGNIFETN